MEEKQLAQMQFNKGLQVFADNSDGNAPDSNNLPNEAYATITSRLSARENEARALQNEVQELKNLISSLQAKGGNSTPTPTPQPQVQPQLDVNSEVLNFINTMKEERVHTLREQQENLIAQTINEFAVQNNWDRDIINEKIKVAALEDGVQDTEEWLMSFANRPKQLNKILFATNVNINPNLTGNKSGNLVNNVSTKDTQIQAVEQKLKSKYAGVKF